MLKVVSLVCSDRLDLIHWNVNVFVCVFSWVYWNRMPSFILLRILGLVSHWTEKKISGLSSVIGKSSVISCVTTKKLLPAYSFCIVIGQLFVSSCCWVRTIEWCFFRCHRLVARWMQHGNERVIKIYRGCGFQALLLKLNKVHHSTRSSCFQNILCILLNQKVTFTLNESWDFGAQFVWLT